MVVATIRAVDAERRHRPHPADGRDRRAGGRLSLILFVIPEKRERARTRPTEAAFDAFAGGLPGAADARRRPRPGRRGAVDRSVRRTDGQPQGTALGPGRRASASPSGPCSRRWSPSSTRSRRSRPRRASTAGTSSTASPTGWRSASAASCAPGPARPTRSTSRARTTPRRSGSRPGERYGRVYQINYLRCILCGLCIEACPTRALTMTNEYELADNNRADLIYEKDDLLAPLLPGMERAAARDAARRRRGRLLPRHRSSDQPRRRDATRSGGADAVIAFWILAPIMVAAALGMPVRPQGRAHRAAAGRGDDQPGGALRRPGRAVPRSPCRSSSTPARS